MIRHYKERWPRKRDLETRIEVDRTVSVRRRIGAYGYQRENAVIIQIVKSCVLPVQIRFSDGYTTGYMPKEVMKPLKRPLAKQIKERLYS